MNIGEPKMEDSSENILITPAEKYVLIRMLDFEKKKRNFSEKETTEQESIESLCKKLFEKEVTNLLLTQTERTFLIGRLIFEMDGGSYPDYTEASKKPIESLYEKLTGKKYFDLRTE